MNRIPFSVLPVGQQFAYSKEDMVAYIQRCEQTIASQNDKLHRRNMQIEDLKKKLNPKCSINENHTMMSLGHKCLECNATIL